MGQFGHTCFKGPFGIYTIMSDYGLKCWNSSGTLTLDLTDTISRLRYSASLAAGASSNVTLADISGKSTVQFAIATETGKLPPVVTRSGTTISWAARSGGPYSASAAFLVVFVYD